MSFVRVVLLVVLVLLLLPSNNEQRFEFYSTAQRTLADLGGFCTRNPDVCENVSAAFQGILDKLKSSTESVEDMLRDAGIAQQQEEYTSGYEHQTSRHENLRSTVAPRGAEDTLTSSDRRPSWRGPNPL